MEKMEPGSNTDNPRGMHSTWQKLPAFGIICFLFIVNLHGAYSITYSEFLASTLPSVCPYSTFCTIDPSKQIKNKFSPCCKSCSCDDDCLTYGNCCPDVHAANKELQSMLSTTKCTAPVHYGYDDFENDIVDEHLQLGFYFHYITSTCPVEFDDHEVINKCKSDDREDLRNMPVVSDGKGRAFSNRYCAKCNDVDTFTRWDLTIICLTYNNSLTDVLNLQAIKSNMCLVTSSPPTKEIAMVSRCFPVEYDTCNVTGKWDNFNSNIQRACHSATFPYVDESTRKSSTYKNPYCYLCNTAADSQVYTNCQSDLTAKQRTGGKVPFVAMLDVSPARRNQLEDTRNTKCKSTEIFDHHFGKCRALHCPVTLLARNGKCVQVFKQTTAIPILITLDGTYVDETTQNFFNFADEKYTSKVEKIIHDIISNVGNTKRPCSICTSTLHYKHNNGGFILATGVLTDTHCDAVSIINSLKKWAFKKTVISVNNNGISLAFTLEWRTPETNFFDLASGYIALFPKASRCLNSFILEPLFYCGHVNMPWVDYIHVTSLNKSNIQNGDFTNRGNGASSGELADNVYSICVDKYLENKNSGVTVNTCPLITSFKMAVSVVLLFIT